MANHDVLAIGASAGGIEALRFLARELPGDLPASVLVTVHLSGDFRSVLDTILSQAGPLPASFPENGEQLQPRHIYLAPPQRHLLLSGDRLQLGVGPRENNSRPAIDPMFRSAALCCGYRTVGVVLTGMLGDGAAGLSELKKLGGTTVVQDPMDALYPSMPVTALSRSKPDHVASLAAMPSLLRTLVQERPGAPVPPTERMRYEVEIARSGRAIMDEMDRIGHRSILSCPDCGGVMWEIDDDVLRYRCHVGHAYTADLLAVAMDENLRRALAIAMRALEEKAGLAKKLRAQATRGEHWHSANSWAARALELEREARVVYDGIRRLDEIAATAASAEKAEGEDAQSEPADRLSEAGANRSVRRS